MQYDCVWIVMMIGFDVLNSSCDITSVCLWFFFQVVVASPTSRETSTIHCLHDFAHKQDSQLNSSVLITVWRVVIENSVTGLPTK